MPTVLQWVKGRPHLFVEEKNDRYRPEPPVVPNGFEKVKGFAQSVLTGVFSEDHVVGRTSRHEDNGCHVIEALDPLTPLVPLTSHVKHTVKHKQRSFIIHRTVAERLQGINEHGQRKIRRKGKKKKRENRRPYTQSRKNNNQLR